MLIHAFDAPNKLDPDQLDILIATQQSDQNFDF
jgi:hypothetical protein